MCTVYEAGQQSRTSSLAVSEDGKQKRAVVQWFVRVSEVPPAKLKLLGRAPHPQEIFYYQGSSCDDEVEVTSILRPVKVNGRDVE